MCHVHDLPYGKKKHPPLQNVKLLLRSRGLKISALRAKMEASDGATNYKSHFSQEI